MPHEGLNLVARQQYIRPRGVNKFQQRLGIVIIPQGGAVKVGGRVTAVGIKHQATISRADYLVFSVVQRSDNGVGGVAGGFCHQHFH